jgi:hypothetical protein
MILGFELSQDHGYDGFLNPADPTLFRRRVLCISADEHCRPEEVSNSIGM